MTTDAALRAHSIEFSSMLVTREGLIGRQWIVDGRRIDSQHEGDVTRTQLIDDQQYEIAVGYGQHHKWPLACMRCHIVDNVVLLIVEHVELALHVTWFETRASQRQMAQPGGILRVAVILGLLFCTIRIHIDVIVMGRYARRQSHQLHNIPQRRMQQPFAYAQQMKQRL